MLFSMINAFTIEPDRHIGTEIEGVTFALERINRLYTCAYYNPVGKSSDSGNTHKEYHQEDEERERTFFLHLCLMVEAFLGLSRRGQIKLSANSDVRPKIAILFITAPPLYSLLLTYTYS